MSAGFAEEFDDADVFALDGVDQRRSAKGVPDMQ